MEQGKSILALLPPTARSSALSRTIANAARHFDLDVEYHPFRGDSEPQELSAVIGRAAAVIADISGESPEVDFILGFAEALAKPIVLIRDEAEAGAGVPTGFRGRRVIWYRQTRNGLADLEVGLVQILGPLSPKIVHQVDAEVLSKDVLDRLSPEPFGNLIYELLTQMGFESVDWVDVASLGPQLAAWWPRTDPGGRQITEPWLVAFGPGWLLRQAVDRVRDGAGLTELAHRLPRKLEPPITLLLIPHQAAASDRESVQRRIHELYSETDTNVRHVFWTTNELQENLAAFPQLAFKYASGEARDASERKSIESLYRENMTLLAEIEATNAELLEERSLRAAAERDAAWKDVAFTAAHKLGNPLFAAETRLANLQRTMGETPSDLSDALGELQRAKEILTEFKSLAQAEKFEFGPVDLAEQIRASGAVAEGKGVSIIYRFTQTPIIEGDAARLRDVFDELFANSLKWMDADDPTIEVGMLIEAGDPDIDEDGMPWVVINFRDNGPGVAPEDVPGIFTPFVSRDPHGTGLGLALVQRIIEAHGGRIWEIGSQGLGADFQINLPLPEHEGD